MEDYTVCPLRAHILVVPMMSNTCGIDFFKMQYGGSGKLQGTFIQISRSYRGFPGSSAGKESACNAGDLGLVPGSRRSTEERIDYRLQCSWASLVS